MPPRARAGTRKAENKSNERTMLSRCFWVSCVKLKMTTTRIGAKGGRQKEENKSKCYESFYLLPVTKIVTSNRSYYHDCYKSTPFVANYMSLSPFV